MMNIGIQVSSLKSVLTTPGEVTSAFERMAALGCRYVQLQWIDPSVPIDHIAALMDRFSMVSLGTQDYYGYVLENLEYYVNLNRATGGVWVTVSRIPEHCKSREGLDVFAGELTALRDRLAPLGQRVCFHPVSADYQAVPGMDPVAYLMEKLPWLELCLDLFHLDRNCGDMPSYIRALSGRIPMVHFKDHRDDVLVPAGQGQVRWEGVIPACLDAGVGCGLAEQESWEGDPYVCLEQAMDWIRRELSDR